VDAKFVFFPVRPFKEVVFIPPPPPHPPLLLTLSLPPSSCPSPTSCPRPTSLTHSRVLPGLLVTPLYGVGVCWCQVPTGLLAAGGAGLVGDRIVEGGPEADGGLVRLCVGVGVHVRVRVRLCLLSPASAPFPYLVLARTASLPSLLIGPSSCMAFSCFPHLVC
jgi:hypothetical protein